MAVRVHSPKKAWFALHPFTSEWISDSLGTAPSIGLWGLLKASNPTYWFVTVDLPSKWRDTMSREMESACGLAGANENMRGQAFALLLMNPLRQNRTWILIRLFQGVLKHLALCMKIKDRNCCLRVLLAIYPPWRGILKCFLCRVWGLSISERVAQQRRQIVGEVQLWKSCFPAVMPLVPHCSCLF